MEIKEFDSHIFKAGDKARQIKNGELHTIASCDFEDKTIGITIDEDNISYTHCSLWEFEEEMKKYSSVKLGTPTTIGELRKIIEKYDDQTGFVFRNQPLQSLYEVKRTGEEAYVCYQ